MIAYIWYEFQLLSLIIEEFRGVSLVPPRLSFPKKSNIGGGKKNKSMSWAKRSDIFSFHNSEWLCYFSKRYST